MKTSLVLSDYVFKAAQRESVESHKTISEIISQWAQLGLEALRSQKEKPAGKFKPISVGKVLVDVNSRHWMDQLSNERF